MKLDLCCETCYKYTDCTIETGSCDKLLRLGFARKPSPDDYRMRHTFGFGPEQEFHINRKLLQYLAECTPEKCECGCPHFKLETYSLGGIGWSHNILCLGCGKDHIKDEFAFV